LIHPQLLNKENQIGSGTFGSVFASTLDGNQSVVVKVFHGDFQDTAQFQNAFSKEAEVSCQLRHPNIVLSLGVVCNTMLVMAREATSLLKIFIVMERKSVFFSPQEVSKLCTDCCMGMNFLHLKGYLHRDMNLGNFLLSSDWTLKISDFGTAEYLGTMQSKLAHAGPGGLL